MNSDLPICREHGGRGGFCDSWIWTKTVWKYSVENIARSAMFQFWICCTFFHFANAFRVFFLLFFLFVLSLVFRCLFDCKNVRGKLQKTAVEKPLGPAATVAIDSVFAGRSSRLVSRPNWMSISFLVFPRMLFFIFFYFSHRKSSNKLASKLIKAWKGGKKLRKMW